ncbi:MAG: DedA family protein [Xanthomonadales bacterium]|nr:DedA family protein [Xanthomonadales bacterium]
MFKKLYDRTLKLSGHRHAPRYLAGLSFAEATFFPIPPDVILLPMLVAKPEKAWYYAFICTMASVVGGVFGYLLGSWGFELFSDWLETSSYYPAFLQAKEALNRWGFWVILVAGFTPIPYKIFTIAAGVIGMPFFLFLGGSVVGRGARFYLEAAIIRIWGESAAGQIRRWVDWLGWGVVVAVVLIIAYLMINYQG